MPRNRGDAQVRLHAVEAAAAGGEQGEGGRERGGGLDAGTKSRVGQGGESLAELKDLVHVSTESCHHGKRPSDRGWPLRVKISCFRSKKA